MIDICAAAVVTCRIAFDTAAGKRKRPTVGNKRAAAASRSIVFDTAAAHSSGAVDAAAVRAVIAADFAVRHGNGAIDAAAIGGRVAADFAAGHGERAAHAAAAGAIVAGSRVAADFAALQREAVVVGIHAAAKAILTAVFRFRGSLVAADFAAGHGERAVVVVDAAAIATIALARAVTADYAAGHGERASVVDAAAAGVRRKHRRLIVGNRAAVHDKDRVRRVIDAAAAVRRTVAGDIARFQNQRSEIHDGAAVVVVMTAVRVIAARDFSGFAVAAVGDSQRRAGHYINGVAVLRWGGLFLFAFLNAETAVNCMPRQVKRRRYAFRDVHNALFVRRFLRP